MRAFAQAIITIAPVTNRKSRNRFLRECDRWSNRLYRRDLISLQQRQDLRRQIAAACLVALM
ncbi:hypothetical protein AYK59_19215 [Pseudomonas synxantha]|nr:hypothetical protein AYK59_19215 [Pseudomonas synxantha]KRA06209.1 hypothetical protein ASD70_15015 [Pseudomonas sp. Root569]OOV89232.1 hypothetical protein MF6394_32370 [Pseudomonas sp. MF6394]